MRKFFNVLLALLASFALVTQFIIMIGNRTTSVAETIIRFFSYYTILTNSLVVYTFFTKPLIVKKTKTVFLTESVFLPLLPFI